MDGDSRDEYGYIEYKHRCGYKGCRCTKPAPRKKNVDWKALKKKEQEASEARWEQFKQNLIWRHWFKVIGKILLVLMVIFFIGVNFFPQYVGLLGFNKCSDDTLNRWCSTNKPYYCNDGKLIYDANTCGCPGNQIVVNGTCKIPFNCTDGTAHGTCSEDQPLYCYNGIMTDKASLCGCPKNQLREGDQCKDLEQMVHVLINEERASYGISELSYDSELAQIARTHSEDMGNRDFFDHVNPDGLDPTARGQREGYTCFKSFGSYYTTGIAENIFQTNTYSAINYVNGVETSRDYMTAEQIATQVVRGWMNSLGHRTNILTTDYDREGIGVDITSDGRIYITEDFC